MEEEKKEHMKKMKEIKKRKQEISLDDAQRMYKTYRAKQWRMERSIREKKLKPHTVAINYVYLDENGQGSKIDHMELDANGKFLKKWRHGFFNERLNEI